MYARGLGVERDNAMAMKWYRRAAAQGDAEGQYHLGLALRRGLDGGEDPEASAEWLRKAAEQGHSLAQARLGTCYEDGSGVPRDLARAYAWFDVAATGGAAVAALKRDEVAKRMTPEQVAAARRLAAGIRSRLAGASTAD
jgi:TPR repeat protein